MLVFDWLASVFVVHILITMRAVIFKHSVLLKSISFLVILSKRYLFCVLICRIVKILTFYFGNKAGCCCCCCPREENFDNNPVVPLLGRQA